MADDARSEGLKFFAKLGDLNVGDCVDGAEKAQCAALWHATGWYKDARLVPKGTAWVALSQKDMRGRRWRRRR